MTVESLDDLPGILAVDESYRSSGRQDYSTYFNYQTYETPLLSPLSSCAFDLPSVGELFSADLLILGVAGVSNAAFRFGPFLVVTLGVRPSSLYECSAEAATFMIGHSYIPKASPLLLATRGVACTLLFSPLRMCALPLVSRSSIS